MKGKMPPQRVSMQKLDLSDDPGDYASEDNMKVPIICLDVKISTNKTEQLLLFEDDDIARITLRFSKKHGKND
jgi:hypothetical protein